jgi:transcription elongation GreA/GreB family factor
MKITYITEQGKLELEKKIQLQKQNIDSIRKEKAIAYEVSGDGWHDNPGFNQLMQLEERAVNELKQMERRLSEVFVLQIKERDTEKVSIGSIVKFRMSRPNVEKEMTYEIVGSGESDLNNNKVSYDSPMGFALLGMKKGEIKSVHIPAGKSIIEIMDLFCAWSDIAQYRQC